GRGERARHGRVRARTSGVGASAPAVASAIGGGNGGTHAGGIGSGRGREPGHAQSPRLSSQGSVRGAVAGDTPMIEGVGTGEAKSCRTAPTPRSRGAPDLPCVAEPKRFLGCERGVEFAAFHVRAAVDHRYANRSPVVAKRHERAAPKRLVRDAESRIRKRAAAGERAPSSIPRGPDEAIDLEPSEPAVRF